MDALAADVLRRCAGGKLAPAVALVRLLIVYRDLDRLRAALAKLVRTGSQPDLQSAIERLHGLLDGKSDASALVLTCSSRRPRLTSQMVRRMKSGAAGVCSTGWWR